MVQIKTDVQIKLSFNEHSIIKKYNFLAIISCEGIADFFVYLLVCLLPLWLHFSGLEVTLDYVTLIVLSDFSL